MNCKRKISHARKPAVKRIPGREPVCRRNRILLSSIRFLNWNMRMTNRGNEVDKGKCQILPHLARVQKKREDTIESKQQPDGAQYKALRD